MKGKNRMLACLLAVALTVQSLPVMAADTAITETDAMKPSIETEQTEPESSQQGEDIASQPDEVSLSTLSGTIFLDKNMDGTFDQEEEVVKAVRVKLYDSAKYEKEGEDAEFEEVVTKDDGTYQFLDLIAGKYRMEICEPKQMEEGTALMGVLSEDMKEKQASGEWDYEIQLPREEDEWIACIPEIEISEEREMNIGLSMSHEEVEGKVPAEDEKEDATAESEDEKAENVEEEGTNQVGSEEEKQEEDLTDSKQPMEETLDPADIPTADVTENNGVLSSVQGILGQKWNYDIYYVHEHESHDVTLTESRNLKYQIEFKANEKIPKNAVQIRVPRTLISDRYGSPITPSEIGVPKGTVEKPVESKVSPFNYYEEDDNIIFFNYGDVKAGTTVAFQVLYRGINLMQIKDNTAWTLESSCTVTTEEGEKTKNAKPLTGKIDSRAVLNNVSILPHAVDGKSYTPGLYTENQVERIIGTLPEKYKTNFKDYHFVAWEVTVHGEATQPWELYMKNTARTDKDAEGAVVGYSVPAEKGSGEYEEYDKITLSPRDPMRFSETFYVVTAYPANASEAGTKLMDQIEMILQPKDQIDQPIKKDAENSWKYADYEWHYEGEKVRIGKDGGGTFPSWLNVYKAAKKEGKDTPGFYFEVESMVQEYDKTHVTEGENFGQLIEGNFYTAITVDDFVYAYPNTRGISSSDYEILDADDYYYDSVIITQSDIGYDPWEDQYATPEVSEENEIEIYAVFEDSENPNDFSRVAGDLEWEDDGSITYKFTPEELARKPWRIGVAHKTVNYSTTCHMELSMVIRHDSPFFSKLVEDVSLENKGNRKVVTVENLAGVMVEVTQDGKTDLLDLGGEDGFKDIYDRETNLKDKSEELWGTLPFRKNALLHMTSLQEHAGAGKSGTSWNDPINGQVHLNYNMTAFDGYDIYGSEAIPHLKAEGVPSPGRDEIIFYDLLPYGVKFDPSVKIRAGRIKNFDENHSYQYYPESWDPSQVSVTVDSKKDIISNYKNSGRTMVIFHVKYSGADAAVYSNQKWVEGFGVSFGAYYDWKDTPIAGDATNIVAVMPADNETPFLGTKDEVALDNGTYPDALGSSKEEYKILGKDIDQDGSEEDTVLYAQTRVMDDSAQAATSGIKKLVRADEDRFGIYADSTKVQPGKGYTYDVTISNVTGSKSGIVAFDHLDQGAEDLKNAEGTFDETRWSGTFNGVITAALEKMGVKPVIYYNADPKAKTASKTEIPASVLTEENGWYEETRWEEEGKTMADVKSVAVDMSTGSNGDPFELAGTKALSFQIMMTAPRNEQEGTAYNIAYIYANDAESNASFDNSSLASVRLGSEKQFALVKEFEGNIPNSVKDTEFVFTIYEEKDGEDRVKFSNQEYQLFEKTKEDTWQRVGEHLVYATDAAGQVKVKAGQKVVFETPKASILSAEEEESPFWKQKVNTTQEETLTTQTVTNKYRPVLYVKKQLKAVPEDYNAKNEEFKFRYEIDGRPVADQEFWYVDSERTDGGIPSKNTDLGTKGVGVTDENGEFTIRSGEIIALFSENADCNYKVTETEGYGEETNWICKNPSVSGTLPYYGATASIENIYKWKDLYLTKELTNQDPEECAQEFTFSITDKEGKPVREKNWVLMEDNKDTEVKGTTDEDGRFTVDCAGKTVRVEDLEGGETYIVEEIDEKSFEDEDYYEPVNRKEEVTIPLYGTLFRLTFTNDYIMRDLKISKVVNYDPDTTSKDEIEEIRNKAFTMTVELQGDPLKNAPYSVLKNEVVIDKGETDENGQFQIKDSETVCFEQMVPIGMTYKVTETEDDKYPQLFPVNQEPIEGTMTKDGVVAQFINGLNNTFVIGKEYVVSNGEDMIEKEYLGKLKDNLRDEAAVELELQVMDAEGEYHTWPTEDTEVLVIDTLTNDKTKETWKKDAAFHVTPWKNVYITNMGEMTSYRLKERAIDQHRVIFYEADDKDQYTLDIHQKLPEKDSALEGTVKENPKAIIVNEIRNLQLVSTVTKRVLAGESKVPEGARLAYRVETYDGRAWSPAEGIEYIVTDRGGIVSDRTEKTDADGMILMYKRATGTPTVEFVDKPVTVHPKNPTVGALRVVEVGEQTDTSWGRFAGYVDRNGKTGIDVWDGIGFANSNTTHGFEVEKVMEQPTDDTFTMILEQILSATELPITDKSQILDKIPGSGIPYTVYSSETNKVVADQITGANGEIYLKAGQYASFQLEDGTEWIVSEKIPNGYTLKDMVTGGGDSSVTTGKLDHNATIINTPEAEEKLPGITLTKEMVETGVLDAETGEVVQLKEGNISIPKKIIVDDVRYCVTAIGKDAFAQNTALKQVRIPDSVTEIQANAFMACINIKKLVLPNSLEKVGDQAFMKVGFGHFNFDMDMETGSYIAKPLKNGAETFKLPQGIKEIGKMAFLGSIVGEAIIPECATLGIGVFGTCIYLQNCGFNQQLKEIPQSTFSTCINPSFAVTIPEGVERIGESAFMQSAFIGKIPDSVTSIGSMAFSNLNRKKKDWKLVLPKNLKTIDKDAFDGAGITELVWNENLESVGMHAFGGNQIVELTVPGDVQFARGTFQYNSKLEKVTIEEGQEKIGEYEFMNCPSLKEVVIKSGVTRIAQGAFSGCQSLERIQLPETLEVIEADVFSDCKTLKEITIPASVQHMGFVKNYGPDTNIFNNCTSLEKITIYGKKRPLNIKDREESGLDTKWGAPDSTRIIWADAP